MQIPFFTIQQHRFNQQRVRFVANFKDVFVVDETEAVQRRLEIIQGLPHVPLGSEDDCFEAVFRKFHLESNTY